MMENICQVIFYTLLHSLWQGLLLALLAGSIMVSTKKRSASLRYDLLTGSLFLFTAMVICTLIWELSIHESDRHPAVDPPFRYSGLLTLLLNTIHRHAETFVIGWLMLVLLKSGRMILGLYTLNRLTTVKTSKVTGFWEQHFADLVEKMKISVPVTLLESGITKIPLVIGYLKPVILIPVGLINSLEPDQVEAILLHELAHVVRNDYLVNLIGKIIGTFFFFNPAVLWVTYLIRSERENCCDDLAINQTQNRFGYMRALISFEEYRHDLPDQALAISGNTGSIPQRIERMISGKNRSLVKLEVIALAIMTLIFVTVSINNSPFSAMGSPAQVQQPPNYTPALSGSPVCTCSACLSPQGNKACLVCGGNSRCQCISTSEPRGLPRRSVPLF